VGLGRVLSLPWFLGKSVSRTGARAAVLRCRQRFRWEQVEFGPDGLSGDGTEFDAPAVGESLDEDQAAPRYSVRGWGLT